MYICGCVYVLCVCVWRLHKLICLKMDSSNNASCYPIDAYPQKESILLKMAVVGGSVSMLSCVVVFIIAVLLHKYRQSSQRLILYLVFSASLTASTYILHGAHHDTEETVYCKAVGFIEQLSTWMILLATCCLTFDLLYKVVSLIFDTRRFEPIYLFIIFVLPFLFNWIPFVKNAYGRSGALCWIKLMEQNDDGQCEINAYFLSLQMVLYYAPAAIIIVGCVIANFYIFVKTWKERRAYTGNFNQALATTKQLIHHEARWYPIYPVVILFLILGGFTSRVIQYTQHDVNFGFRVLHVLSFSLQGLATSMVFILDYDTRKQLLEYNTIKVALNTLCCCFLRSSSVKEYNFIKAESDSIRAGSSSTPYSKLSDDNIQVTGTV